VFALPSWEMVGSQLQLLTLNMDNFQDLFCLSLLNLLLSDLGKGNVDLFSCEGMDKAVDLEMHLESRGASFAWLS
jgi:hypothetical protein